jgi:hypothetical protein
MWIAPALLMMACGSQLVVFPNDASTADVVPVEAGVETSLPDLFVPEVGKDVQPEVGMDVQPEVGMDVQQEVGMETSIEAGMETGMDAPMEVGMDVQPEVGMDSPMEVGGCLPGKTSPVNLGTAGNFAVLAKSGISSVPASMVTGDIGVSPIAASAITGFSLTPCTGTCPSSTSTQVIGSVYAADYGPPTPTMMTTAVGDMGTAISDASGRAPDFTELGSGDIGSLVLAPGVYKWSTGVTIPTDVTLKGGCGDVWIFEIAQGLTMASAKNVVLSGGALASNVFWQVTGAVEVGANSHFNGTILCATAITMDTGSSVNGSLLAQTAVNLQQAIVVKQ